MVAIATPGGRGGIGVVRLSGVRAREVAHALLTRKAPLEPRRATFTRIAPGARPLAPGLPAVGDEVVATFFPQPHSYTGQDVVEISAHGSPVVLRSIVEQACAHGARLAQPGEFTLRAFLAGKKDLVQAEAVADLVDAVTPLQARVAFDQLEGTLTARIAAIDGLLFDLLARLEASLDFPDEGYHFIEPAEIAAAIDRVTRDVDVLLADAGRGRVIREGATVVIAGRPNVGKSSLFNALAGAERAIVTSVPGTTRDLITERVDVGGLAVTLVDTAGSRDTLDIVEREGVQRGDRAREVADLVVLVLDASEPVTRDDETLLRRTEGRPRLVVANKIDVAARTVEGALPVSVVTGSGLADLRERIAAMLLGTSDRRDPPALTNVRHAALLRHARELLERASAAASERTPEEFVLTDLQAARACFDEVVGGRTSEDLLRHIFERFCIGK